MDHAQIGERVADLRALVEARAADHAIGQAEGDEAVLELAHLERGAHQDGDLVERMLRALQLLDLLADGAGFLLGIPGAGDGDLLARHVLGAQRLAEPALVVGDQVRGGGEDVAGGAVVALQPDDLGAGEVVVEAQDVVDLGAAPAIDRLVVVADAADVFRWCVAVSFLVPLHLLPFPLPLWERVGRAAGAGEGLRTSRRTPSPGSLARHPLPLGERERKSPDRCRAGSAEIPPDSDPAGSAAPAPALDRPAADSPVPSAAGSPAESCRASSAAPSPAPCRAAAP